MIDKISNFVSILKSKGLSSEEISQILLEITTEVEMEVIEEIEDKLSDEKRWLLQEMIKQNKSSSEIAQRLQLDEEEIQKLELQKLSEIIERMSPFLNFE